MKLNPSQQNALMSRIARFYQATQNTPDRRAKRVELLAYVEKLREDAYTKGFDEGVSK